MIHSIYNQVGKVGLTPCSKERPKQLIPLLKSNFLGEFQTELEKKLARESIGVTVTGKYTYKPDSDHITNIEQITSIYEALDYALTLAKSYQDKKIEEQIETIKTNINQLISTTTSQGQELSTLKELVNTINTQVGTLNGQLANLNVMIKQKLGLELTQVQQP